MDFKRITEYHSYQWGEEIGFLIGYIIFFTMMYVMFSKFTAHTWNSIYYGYLMCFILMMYAVIRVIRKYTRKEHMQ